MRYSPNALKLFCAAVLELYGCDAQESDIVASHLVEANLTGHDSHGIGMLPIYGEQVLDGNLIPNQSPDLQPAIGAISVVDAKRGFGHRMALLALDHAMQQIEVHKVSILALRDSGHVSRVGTYSEYCAARGYVSLHFVNVVGHPPLVAPYGAAEGGFSTNPISMAMPVNAQAKPLLDIATSTVAFGKVRVANNTGQMMPPGCLIDDHGTETLDPAPMANERRGALAAFGAHKGSGLGIFVELLAGALASEHTVATLPYLPRGVINNMFSIIIDPSAFDDASNIEQRTEEFYAYIKSRQNATGVDEILMPGEPENHNRKTRTRDGIDVDAQTIKQIMDVVQQFPDVTESQCNTLTQLLES